MLHPDDVGMIEETLATALRTLEPFTYTHRMVLGDLRTERVFECFGEVFADAEGVPSRTLHCHVPVAVMLSSRWSRHCAVSGPSAWASSP